MKYFVLAALLTCVVIGGWFAYTVVNEEGSPQETSGTVTPSPIDDSEVESEMRSNKYGLTTLATVYDGVTIPVNSKKLDLSGRGLTGSLKAEIRHVTTLEELDLSNNKFTGLPAEVGQLSNLRILDLSNNPLTGLPHELANLKNLEVLDLRGTEYSFQDLEVIRVGLKDDSVIIID